MCIRDRFINSCNNFKKIKHPLIFFDPACEHQTEGLVWILLVNPGIETCLLYTSDAADERSSVDLGGRRIIKKKNNENTEGSRYST